MKISYIILPFESAEYLIRCVNSLYRQTGDAYEVILAENEFGEDAEKIEEFLASRPELLRIPGPGRTDAAAREGEGTADMAARERADTAKQEGAGTAARRREKLSRAFSLVSPESSHVMFLDVETVAAPVCARAVLECGGRGLVVPGAAIKKGDIFEADCPGLPDILKKFDEYIPQRFCYGRELFDRFLPEYLEDYGSFAIFLLSEAAGETEVRCTSDICIYAATFSVPEGYGGYEGAVSERWKEQCGTAFSRLPDIGDVQARLVIFEKLIRRAFLLLEDEDPETRREGYGLLKSFYRGVQDDFLLKRLIEEKAGAASEDFAAMDYGEYLVYRTYGLGMRRGSASGSEEQDRLLDGIKAASASAEKHAGNIREELELVRKELLFLAQSRNQEAAAAIEAGRARPDYAADVPRMYREGRLGLRTIIRSFNGWLKYKFSGKK